MKREGEETMELKILGELAQVELTETGEKKSLREELARMTIDFPGWETK